MDQNELRVSKKYVLIAEHRRDRLDVVEDKVWMKDLLNRKAGKDDTKKGLYTKRVKMVNIAVRCDSIRQISRVDTLKTLQDTIRQYQQMLHHEHSNQRLWHLYALQILEDTTPS